MSVERRDEPDNFLDRWSRRKKEAGEEAQRAAEPAPVQPAAQQPLPELPPLEKLTLESDYSGFFHPEVGEDTRRAALRKLFSDPHFNVMDGLDVYIDDYSKSEPIPAAMLAGLRQAQNILNWAAGKGDVVDPAEPEVQADSAVNTPAPKPAALDGPQGQADALAATEPEAEPARKT